ncbi:uncharacterized protein LOC114844422 isoform X2 [Betta splendens]|uniref:Uncharacterized protein LOC114844422 isoform X2 n=1 Tax=Betta splendens TaxID=158456 RepID=A0A6P7KYT3_BETSP|nr:uncharacterized protein LOC114844422 isoform X2 [Betta splendens]
MLVAPAWKVFPDWLLRAVRVRVEAHIQVWSFSGCEQCSVFISLTCGGSEAGSQTDLQRRGVAMAVALLWLFYLLIALLPADCFQGEPHLCDSSCAGLPAPDLSFQRGVRYTYRYSTTVTTSLHGSNAGRNGLALDCVVDIDVVSKCHLMMQIRNPQIKRLSPQKEHSVQRLKSLRESLERTRLKFSLRRGKVTALCLQEGEQVWALNIKRALLSMLQTSRTASKQELQKETDVYGTCTSRYERQGAVLLKTRDLKQCQESRLANLWPRSVVLSEDTPVQTELHCVQRSGSTVMEEVNCTEAVSVATWSKAPGHLKTQTVSTLLLLRAQPGAPSGAESLNGGALTDLTFEEEGAPRERKFRNSTPLQASQTVRRLCSTTSDLQRTSQEFLQLTFQLRDLTLSQLKMLWQEVSFKCRNDWQPLLDALPVCGSENCLVLLTDLIRNKEVEEEQARSFLTTIALAPHPSPQIIDSINALLEVPELQTKALLAGSSLVYQVCQRSQTPCDKLPHVQTFLKTLWETLKEGCEKPARLTEVLYGLKSVGNAGLSAQTFIPLLNRCVLGHSTTLQLRLAAVQAFRRFPCSADRSVLLQLYRSSQEDPEVRIAAYQQLMRCPDQNIFTVVRITLRNETSSQVGSYVWNHLKNILRSEDPMKQSLIESLPDDIISRDFEAEFLKYSSYSDYTFATGMGIINLETSLIFSSKSFLPRSASANLTLYFYGRAHNLLEVDLHVENAESLMKNIFGHQTPDSDEESANQKHEKEARRTRRRTDDDNRKGKETCSSSTNSFITQAKAMLSGRRRTEENSPRCWVAVKVFGNELSTFTCEDLHRQIDQLSLSMAGLAVKLLKGHEVQLNHRAVPMSDQLILPSLSGLPIKMGINMTSLVSLRLKGNVNYRDTSHFSLTGHVKPTVYVGLSVRMGVDGALGQAALDWVSELRSSTSLDGSVQLQEGRDARVMLNTPEDVMDVISLSSHVFQLSGDHREEIKGPKYRVEKTTCTPKAWSKMVGWQLCSNSSYPSLSTGVLLPPPGPVHFSLRLLKLDRGLRYYLLEAAYSLLPQRGTWFPREVSIHLLLATPQSSISRDMSLDLAFSPHRLLLRMAHPLKTIHIQGQMEQEGKIKSGKLELIIDGVSYYIMGLVDAQMLLSDHRTRYHLEAKMAADRHPMILSANVTRELGRKTSFSATVKNVFRDTMSLSVALERRRDSSSRQYSLEAETLLPGVLGSRMLGLMEHKGSVWSSALRLKYGLGGDARHLRHECYTSQRMRSERDANRTYIMRADHEFYCSNTAPINHKMHLRHEESPRHVKSSLELSYGEHWDEINNKCKLQLSQSLRNQSTPNHTSYALEFSLQMPEKNLNYRTQLLHSHLRQFGSESSTHLKINYNNQMPLVAGLHWKSNLIDPLQRKWEGTFNMDTPWLYIYTTHKLNQLQQHTLQLTSELTASKWLTIRNLVLEGFYRDRGREREARLELYTPAATYVQTGGWCMVGKWSVKVSCSLSSLWTPPLRGDISLEASKSSHTLQMSSSLGKHNISIAAALSNVDKNLKKRQVTLKATLSKPKSSPAELDFEGAVQELRKDKKMYQKTAVLKLRQPFHTFPQNLLLRETFTVDLLKGLYVLESKGIFSDSREVIHTLTLGYRPHSPFICSALVHPFNSDTVPSDSEMCVTVSSNQTQKDMQGRLRVGSKDRLTFFGQVQLNPSQSSHQSVKVKANFTHQLQLQLPASALMEGDVHWKSKNNTDFDYQTRGKLRIERQECQLSLHLNGTSGRVGLYSSLRHPFKSKLPKTLEVKATAGLCAVSGTGSSSVHVRADGKDRVKLDAQMSHFHHSQDRGVGIKMNLSQSLLPVATDLHLNMAANMSSDSVSLHGSYTQGRKALLAQMKGSLKNTRGLQLAVSGDLRHSMASLAILPAALGLDGALAQSDTLTEGQLRVRVMDTVYCVELRHQEDPAETPDRLEDEGMLGEKSHEARDWLCVWSGEENLCVNVSRQHWNQGRGEIHTRLSHSFQKLNATGLPANSSAQMRWTLDSNTLSVTAELQAGPEHLTAEFTGGRTDHLMPRWECFSNLQHQVKVLLDRGLPSSLQTKAHYQSEAAGLNTGLDLVIEDVRTASVLFSIGSKNSTALMVMSLWQQMKLLQGLIPTSLQMNCTGDATADRLSARCYGNVSGHPVETVLPPQSSIDISVSRSGSSTSVSTVLQAEGKQNASLMLHLAHQPSLTVRASLQNSIDRMLRLGFPSRGEVSLNASTQHGVWVGLELGNCYIQGGFVKNKDTEGEQTSYSVTGTNSCPALQGTVLPVFVTLQGFLSVAPCSLMLTSSLRADNRSLSLDLSRSCRPQHLSGSLAHSFPALKRHGLPPVLNIEATSGGASQVNSLFVKVGTCHIRANRDTESKTQTKWLWSLESRCPLLQTQLNGSVSQDPDGSWIAEVETVLQEKRAFLRLNARPWPELSVEGQFSHNLPALRGLPERSTIKVTSRVGKQQHDSEALVQMDECAIRARGALVSQPGLQGSLAYHNNCSVIQEWGSPGRMLVSGSLLVSPASAISEVAMTIDDTGLQGLVALKKTKDQHEASLYLNHSALPLKKLGLPLKTALTLNSGSHSNGSYFYIFKANAGAQMITHELTVLKASKTIRVNGNLRHTVSYLKTVGFPANNSLQVELGSAEGKTLTLQSQFGGQQAGLRVKMRAVSMTKDLRGGMWHSWRWLQDRGVPLKVEGLCSIQGVFSQLQSRAQLTVDSHKLLTSGFNVSTADGRLAVHVSFSPPPSNRTQAPDSLDAALAAQYKGPLWSASVDVTRPDWRVRMMGDLGGHGGSKDARITLRHTVQGQTSPTLQVEAWGRLTESQLRCSMAVNPELSSSLALIIQGHHLPHSKDLMVKVVQNIPKISLYLPSQLNVRSQLNQTQSSVTGLVEVSSGRRSLWALGELAAIGGGYRQAVELKHSYPQLKPLPRNVAVRTVYEGRDWTYQVQHGAVWGNQEFSLSGIYSAPATLEMGNHTLKVHIKCVPRWTSLDVTLERSLRGRLDAVLLGWTRHGRPEQVSALSSWSHSEDLNETKLELRQPFSSTLSQVSFDAHSSKRGKQSSHQASLSWNSTVPTNISLSLNQQWRNTSSRGQACAVFSTQQMVSFVKGCVSVGQEGNSYSQNAALTWENKSVTQGMTYQKGPRGLHSLQVDVELDRVSPAPCPSHTLLVNVQTNLRDHLEHTVQLGLCPPQPTLSWAGSHRVNAGRELFYTQSRLSVTGRPNQCSLTLVLTNSSTAQCTNMSLFSESRMGNWSVQVGGSALSWHRGSGLQVQAALDQREKIWLSGMLEGPCLQATAGYMNDSGPDEVLTVAACARTNRTFALEVQKKVNSSKPETLGSLSVGSAQQKLVLKASGCAESLTSAETRLHGLISHMQKRLLERIKRVQRLLAEFRVQSTDGDVLQQLIALPLDASQCVEAVLSQRGRGLLAPWQSSFLRRTVTDSLPRFLRQLHNASLLGQQELRKPLATLAGVYQDVKGQRLEALWKQPLSLWTEMLVEVVSALLGNPQLKPLVQAGVGTLSAAVEVAGQHSYQWMEARLATALSGLRKRLASVYKLSPSECSVTVSVPLPPIPWSRVSEAGLVEILLEEWLLRPLQTVATIRPTAELYHLKRKLMDGPFIHQALLVADQFVVTFDGHLFELPAPCPLVMAQSVNANPSFTLLLASDSQNLLLVEMNNSTISIQRSGQVKTNCSNTVTHSFHSDSGVDVRRGANFVHVSNQGGVSVSCDLPLELCSFTTDGWLHGSSTGLFGTNDNEAGNDFLLPDGSRAENLDSFFHSWQVNPECVGPRRATQRSSETTTSPFNCEHLFSSPDSPLSSCFRVVDPGQFLSVCEPSSSRAPCRLAAAFVHLCRQNYVPLEVPVQCLKV